MSEPTAARLAENIVRAHMTECAGALEPVAPWCCCAPPGTPLCESCANLAEAIAAQLQTLQETAARAEARLTQDRDDLKAHVVSLSERLGELGGRGTLYEAIGQIGRRAETLEAERDEARSSSQRLEIEVEKLTTEVGELNGYLDREGL